MRGLRVTGWLLLLTWSGALLAHAHLKASTPADGSRLSAPPAALVLTFSEPAQLTALSLETPAGTEKLPRPQGAQTSVRVPLPPLSPGEYVVHFRTLAADGHVAPGAIRFAIAP